MFRCSYSDNALVCIIELYDLTPFIDGPKAERCGKARSQAQYTSYTPLDAATPQFYTLIYLAI
jgi:hypothetical protein